MSTCAPQRMVNPVPEKTVRSRPELAGYLNEEERQALSRYSSILTTLITLVWVVFFWGGIQYLDERFFEHRFNPTRHVIVEQDPDTYEIRAWRDAFGRVYTPADPHVKYFPLAVSGLVLLLLGAGVGVHQLLVGHYIMLLLIRSNRLALRKR